MYLCLIWVAHEAESGHILPKNVVDEVQRAVQALFEPICAHHDAITMVQRGQLDLPTSATAPLREMKSCQAQAKNNCK
jgi:hypothetical protein